MGGFNSIPYAPPTMYSPRNDRIIDLIMHQGDVAARNAAAQGQIWGNAVQQLGGIAADYVGQRQEQKAAQKREALFQETLDTWNPQEPMQNYRRLASLFGPEDAAKIHQGIESIRVQEEEPSPELFGQRIGALEALNRKSPGWIEKNWQTVGPMLAPGAKKFLGVELGPEFKPEYADALGTLNEQFNPKKDEAGFTLGAGQVRYDAQGNQIAAGPAEAPKTDSFTLGEGQVRYGADGKVLARGPAKTPGEGGEPLVAIMGPDGNPVLVPRSQAAGKRPANIREQGRPVVSGDAGRIADLDTSLNDLSTLTTTLSGSKATGTAAKAGAMLPNWVTEATGVGGEAKSKQAVIDRVKQVIGKALEGGVLRKEDEYKYEKILPTIGDVPTVVKSKLEGLDKAIRQRRQTTLDALSDAGYDVSRFEERGAPGAAGEDDPLGIR